MWTSAGALPEGGMGRHIKLAHQKPFVDPGTPAGSTYMRQQRLIEDRKKRSSAQQAAGSKTHFSRPTIASGQKHRRLDDHPPEIQPWLRKSPI